MKRNNNITITRTKTATGYDITARNTLTYTVIYFSLGNYTPRRNEYERGLKYHLYVTAYDINGDRHDSPTGLLFATIAEAVGYIERYYSIYI